MPWMFNPFTANFDYYQRAGSVTDPHPGSDLEMESGFFLLLEDGTSTLKLEA